MKHILNNKNMYVVAYYFVNVNASIIISILTKQKPSNIRASRLLLGAWNC